MPPRAFLAFDLPDRPRALLVRAGEAFRALAPAWAGEKWVAPALLHATVAFIGPVPDPAVELVLAELGRALADAPAFDLRLQGVRAVPRPRRATMVWADLGGEADTARDVHARCARVLEDVLGVECDGRPFAPHVTLARARATRPAPEVALAAAARVIGEEEAPGKDPDGLLSVREITLYASTLGRGGPAYERLGAAVLGGGGPDTGR